MVFCGLDKCDNMTLTQYQINVMKKALSEQGGTWNKDPITKDVSNWTAKQIDADITKMSERRDLLGATLRERGDKLLLKYSFRGI